MAHSYTDTIDSNDVARPNEQASNCLNAANYVCTEPLTGASPGN